MTTKHIQRLDALRARGWAVSDPFDGDGGLTLKMDKGRTRLRLSMEWGTTYARTLGALLKQAEHVTR